MLWPGPTVKDPNGIAKSSSAHYRPYFASVLVAFFYSVVYLAWRKKPFVGKVALMRVSCGGEGVACFRTSCYFLGILRIKSRTSRTVLGLAIAWPSVSNDVVLEISLTTSKIACPKIPRILFHSIKHKKAKV